MKNEESQEAYFVNPDGIKLFRMIYKATGQTTKAIVFICHGLFEHCQAEYYEPIIRPLNEIECMVITHDHQGHGRSEGERGMIFDFDKIVNDVLLDIDDVILSQKLDPTLPVFIYGHSMGGLIAVYAALNRKDFFTGICLEAPLLLMTTKLNSFAIYLLRLLSSIFPSMPISRLKYEDITRDLDYLELLKQDEWRIHAPIPLITGLSLFNAVERLSTSVRDVTTSFIVGHGNDDLLCPIEGSQSFMELVPIKDKKILVYPNAKHQLRMETCGVNLQFSKEIVDWIKNRY